jgi:hypothetical protein
LRRGILLQNRTGAKGRVGAAEVKAGEAIGADIVKKQDQERKQELKKLVKANAYKGECKSRCKSRNGIGLREGAEIGSEAESGTQE